MFGKTLLAGAAAAMLVSAAAHAASAQTPAAAPPPPPSDQATQPMTSTTPSGTPYSDSGSGLPPDPSDMPRAHNSNSAAQHASDSAAQTGDNDARQIEQCKAMPNDQMMKNGNCAALAKKHPTMMNGGANQPQ